MYYLSESEQLYEIQYLGVEKKRVFETEIHKKLFLDSMEEWSEQRRREEAIYAYCVLDDQAVILVSIMDDVILKRMEEEIWEMYNERLIETGMEAKERTQCQIIDRRLETADFEEACIRIHYLPEKENYVIWAENYWWDSYQEYLGRNWMAFQIGRFRNDEKRSIREIKRMHRQWKKQHQEGRL